ncbi:MAG: hypothetical protein IJ833_07185 [Lachnospiraceae bacterium]|nr:hypothetical protein [Lachnospiraceae bacterium]
MKEATTTYSALDYAVRNHKDTVFCTLFHDKKELLALYNAINQTHYDNPDDLQITTLPDATYMKMKNDVSFLFQMNLSLYEHQSTVCGNLCLRFLLYVASVMNNLVKTKDLYSTKQITLPAPHFVTFYNGRAKQPERKVFSLADAFELRDEEPALDLKVLQLNINPGYNEELMKNCPTLYQYTVYVEKVRKYAQEMSISQSVALAIDTCISEGILADFFQNNREKVFQMSLNEFNEELHNQNLYEEGRDEGYASGHEDGYFSGIRDLILSYKEEGLVKEQIMDKLVKIFHLNSDRAAEYYQKVISAPNEMLQHENK